MAEFRLESKEQEYEAKLAALRAAIVEGENSGIAAAGVFARVRKKLEFPITSRPR